MLSMMWEEAQGEASRWSGYIGTFSLDDNNRSLQDADGWARLYRGSAEYVPDAHVLDGRTDSGAKRDGHRRQDRPTVCRRYIQPEDQAHTSGERDQDSPRSMIRLIWDFVNRNTPTCSRGTLPSPYNHFRWNISILKGLGFYPGLSAFRAHELDVKRMVGRTLELETPLCRLMGMTACRRTRERNRLT